MADRVDAVMEDLTDKDLEDFDIDNFNDELDYLDRYERETLQMQAD